MAIPTKGSRKITVDNENYKWLIRRRVPFSVYYGSARLTLAVDHAENSGSVLVIKTDIEHPYNYSEHPKIPITPSDVAVWITKARKLGWNPQQKGPQFIVVIVDGVMSKFKKI